MKILRGTGVALVTPFTANGEVDYNGLKSLLAYTGEHVDYFVALGTTGETATLNKEEKANILAFVKSNNPKKLPIVLGIGGNNTAQVIKDIHDANLDGVTAILSVSPYYNKPSQAGIIAHYTAIANASSLPIILYNVPGRTMSNISPETTLKLSQHKNIIGIKEACGDLEQTGKIAAQKSDDFMLISGEDLVTAPMIEQGAIGVISVLANGFPKEFSEVSRRALSNDKDGAMSASSYFDEINPLMYEESNPVGVKEVLRLKGVCGNHVRLPLLPASERLRKKILQLL